MSSSVTAHGSKAAGPSSQTSMLLLLLKMRTFVALILVFAFFAVAAPNFLTGANMLIISKHVALNALLAIGMTFVIVSGGIDLSVGSIVGLCAMVAGWLVLYGIDLQIGWSLQFNTLEICLVVAVVGVLIGLINGFDAGSCAAAGPAAATVAVAAMARPPPTPPTSWRRERGIRLWSSVAMVAPRAMPMGTAPPGDRFGARCRRAEAKSGCPGGHEPRL